MFTLHNITKASWDTYSVTSHTCACGATETATIGSDKVFLYHSGANAQEVLSEYSPSFREHFISGICKDCWDKMFLFIED